MTEKLRKCSKCHTELPPSAKSWYCKVCQQQYTKEYHQKNKERLNKKSNAYYKDNTEKMLAANRLYGKKYREENKEKEKARMKAYYEKTKKKGEQ